MEPMELKTTVLDLGGGVYAIDQGMVRCFLILGSEQALLLDTGAGPCDLLGMIREITSLPLTVVQTHGDGDHTANSGQFDRIYAHPAEFDVIRRFRPGLEAELLPVTEGTRFSLGGRTLETVEAPGHTPGSICLLDRENRILFSGDTLSHGPVFLFGGHRDIRRFRETLDKLQALGGFDVIYPCHNTCPVGLSVIGELRDAVDGALDGSLTGESFGDMPMPGGEMPLRYSVGESGILYV